MITIVPLCLFIDWVMTLSAELEQVFWQEVKAYEEAQQMPYISSIERLGMQKGLEQGRQEGRQEGELVGRQAILSESIQWRSSLRPIMTPPRTDAPALSQLQDLAELSTAFIVSPIAITGSW